MLFHFRIPLSLNKTQLQSTTTAHGIKTLIFLSNTRTSIISGRSRERDIWSLCRGGRWIEVLSIPVYSWQFFGTLAGGRQLKIGRLIEVRLNMTNISFLLFSVFCLAHVSVTKIVRKIDLIHLARKDARTFDRGHYLFREANRFPQASLSENCELRPTDNVQGQISEHIFTLTGG